MNVLNSIFYSVCSPTYYTLKVIFYFFQFFIFFKFYPSQLFHSRSLEHSTILYESPDLTPLLRIAWNKQDPNYLATILTDSPKAVILDIRYVRKYVRCEKIIENMPHYSFIEAVD